MPPTSPFLNSRFHVEIDGVSEIEFAEVILPECSAEVVEYRDGSDPRGARKRIGTIRVGNLVLRRGVTESNHLFAWWTNIANGELDRRMVTVTLLDEQRQVVKQWSLSGVWPSRYYVSCLFTDGDAMTLMETVECATDGMSVVS